ncbi:MAG TPA: aldehyde dehydrogenase family protein [Steroidobacteraceae bacterium]|nr:aldehyde dehydrogenase family protein [Steroidobacteraceae bacterium]
MIEDKLNALRAGFASGITLNIEWRLFQLSQLQRLLFDNQQRFVAALQDDLGKCAFETATTEIQVVISEISYALRHVKKWAMPQPVSSPLITQFARSWTIAEPKGVVLIMGAWNYPVQLLGSPLVGAIAAGNAVVLKPSELASHTAQLWAELIPRYLDINCYAVVPGGVNETTELLKQKFDHILYTGGGRVARIVMTAAAQHLTPVTLELGGKSPCIVAADADIDITARRIAWGKFLNAGQTCIAPDYVLVEQQVAAPLQEAIKRWLLKFYGDNPVNSPDYARIVNTAHMDRLISLLDNQAVVHGGQFDREKRYVEPTLISDPSPLSTLMQEEIFGPILPLLSVTTIDTAIEFVRERPKPLALYVFSSSQTTQQHIVARLSAGNVCINDTLMFMAAPRLPFGGIGDSGMGCYHGKHGFDTFSHAKSIMRRSWWPDPSWRYPPFSESKLRILQRLW